MSAYGLMQAYVRSCVSQVSKESAMDQIHHAILGRTGGFYGL